VFRLFTVYGHFGRPDMAPFKFLEAARQGRAIDVYGGGNHIRDFTFVDDLIFALMRLSDVIPQADGARLCPADTLSPHGPYRIVNIGGGNPVGLMDFIDTVERVTGRPIKRNMLPMQKGDVPRTICDPGLLQALTGHVPNTPIHEGMSRYYEWFEAYYPAKA
jgi:UDP-glucuronate 4-epimerase